LAGANVLEAESGDSKEGIVAINVPYAQTKDIVAKEDLGGVKEIIKPVWRNIIVCKG
jgi:hypothetical protein